jgi:cytochrome c oxidase subunit III
LSDSQATAEHVHGPELRHHFAEVEQQKDASTLGMWLFLGTEIMFFGGMFCAYLIYRRLYFNEFAAASQTLDITLGAVNTAVLLLSSLTVVLAVHAAQTGKKNRLVANLVLTLVLGVAFLGIKAVEYGDKFKHHHVPGYNFSFEKEAHIGHETVAIEPRHAVLFFSLYFAMTGMHATHMIIGIGIFIWLLVGAMKGKYSPAYSTPVEIAGLYWHFVDIVWIYLFPLLYLISRHH